MDLERFNPGPKSKDLLQSLGVPSNTPTVGIVAMLRPEKGHDIFLKAAALVLKQKPETHFLIIGDGDERKKLEGMAEDTSIKAYIHFLGARKDIPEILNLFDVAVLSSYPVVETLSNAVLEYMAAGKPVVSTRVGSLEEVVDEGQTGFLVESGDFEAMAVLILKILQDAKLAREMGEAGRKKVEKEYSIEQMVSLTESLFEKLLLEKKGRA